MSDEKEEVLAFLDLETTGTDQARDYVLEVAMVAVIQQTLVPLWEQSALVRTPVDARALVESPVVIEMHKGNGLFRDHWSAMKLGTHGTLDEILCGFYANLQKAGGGERWTPRIVLAGYSVQFDRGFITAQAPLFAKRLHHRIVDVSTIRCCAKLWAPSIVPDQPSAHRALADCYAALAELRVYREFFAALPPQP